ncbi:MAG: preprotein translocase subunit YajC [Planctomycetaceae bacterium]|nr:preprotein translocase subunit YajC [Planctomycetaceae bacterium]
MIGSQAGGDNPLRDSAMWPIEDILPSLMLFAQEQQPANSPFGGLDRLLPPMIIIGLLFYFLIARPERKRKAEMNDMLGNLKKNDRVVTVGGLYGVVVNVSKDAEDVTLRVDDSNNTRLRVLRSAISRVIVDSDNSGSKDSP